MSKTNFTAGLKRYDLEDDYTQGICGLIENPNGKYVEFSDVEHLIEALKTAHLNACSCCNSHEEVQRHCQEALSKIGMGE